MNELTLLDFYVGQLLVAKGASCLKSGGGIEAGSDFARRLFDEAEVLLREREKRLAQAKAAP